MRTFSAITIIVVAGVVQFADSVVKILFGALNILRNFRQIGNPHGRFILFYQLFQRYAVEVEVVVFHFESILREVKRLLDEIKVGIFQFLLVRLIVTIINFSSSAKIITLHI